MTLRARGRRAPTARPAPARSRPPAGSFATPCFMPVGTRGAVRTLSSADLEALGAEVVLGNTYHLMLRPGADVVDRLGGLHGFTGWRRARAHRLRRLPGVLARAQGRRRRRRPSARPTTAATHRLTPEGAVAVQEQLGADIQMVLDVCPPLPSPDPSAPRWPSTAPRRGRRGPAGVPRPRAARPSACSASCRAASTWRCGPRAPSARSPSGFDGYAHRRPVGRREPRPRCCPPSPPPLAELPADRPRYLMGVGDPVGPGRGGRPRRRPVRLRAARPASPATAPCSPTAGRLNLRNAALRRRRPARSTRPARARCAPAGRAATSATCSRSASRPRPRLLTIHNLAWTLAPRRPASGRPSRPARFAALRAEVARRCWALTAAGGADGGGMRSVARADRALASPAVHGAADPPRRHLRCCCGCCSSVPQQRRVRAHQALVASARGRRRGRADRGHLRHASSTSTTRIVQLEVAAGRRAAASPGRPSLRRRRGRRPASTARRPTTDARRRSPTTTPCELMPPQASACPSSLILVVGLRRRCSRPLVVGQQPRARPRPPGRRVGRARADGRRRPATRSTRPSRSSATASTPSAWPSPRSPARATPSSCSCPASTNRDRALEIVGQTAELRFRPVLQHGQLPEDEVADAQAAADDQVTAVDHDDHGTGRRRRRRDDHLEHADDRRRRRRPTRAHGRRRPTPPRSRARARPAPAQDPTTTTAPPTTAPADPTATTAPADPTDDDRAGRADRRARPAAHPDDDQDVADQPVTLAGQGRHDRLLRSARPARERRASSATARGRHPDRPVGRQPRDPRRRGRHRPVQRARGAVLQRRRPDRVPDRPARHRARRRGAVGARRSTTPTFDARRHLDLRQLHRGRGQGPGPRAALRRPAGRARAPDACRRCRPPSARTRCGPASSPAPSASPSSPLYMLALLPGPRPRRDRSAWPSGPRCMYSIISCLGETQGLALTLAGRHRHHRVGRRHRRLLRRVLRAAEGRDPVGQDASASSVDRGFQRAFRTILTADIVVASSAPLLLYC